MGCVCVVRGSRLFFFFFPFSPTPTALVLVETWCLDQEPGGSRAARNAVKAQKQLAEKAAVDAAAAAADASAAAAAEKRQRQQTLTAAERKAAQEAAHELRDAEKGREEKICQARRGEGEETRRVVGVVGVGGRRRRRRVQQRRRAAQRPRRAQARQGRPAGRHLVVQQGGNM